MVVETGKSTRMVLGMLAGALLACPAAANDAGKVVATVNGTEITLGHIALQREQLPPQYQQLPDDVLYKGILEQIIQQTVLSQTVEGKLTRRDETALENDRRAYLAGAALQGVVSVAVTEATLQAAYDARFRDAAPQTEYNASHILVESEEEAARLKAEIEAGADFAAIARQHSKDGAGPGGGNLGWFGLGMMVKPFEEAVVALAPGALGGPVQTQFGWHLIKLNETRIASAPALEEVRAELAAEIEQQAVEARIKELTDAATITRTEEAIDPAFLRDQTLFGN